MQAIGDLPNAWIPVHIMNAMFAPALRQIPRLPVLCLNHMILEKLFDVVEVATLRDSVVVVAIR